MQEFNLKEWLKNTSRKIITRNKKSVRIICNDSPDKEYPIVGFVEGDLEPQTWNLYGKYNHELSNGSYDLFFADEEENLSEERIRKDIVEAVETYGDFTQGRKEEIYAWLEKQDEQKLTDKVEPKFKVGDWVTDGISKCQIRFIDDIQYWYSENCILGSIEFVDKRYHLWTIQDARDGDVLAEHETIVLFKKIEGQNIRCYCTYHYLGFNPTFYVGTLQYKSPYYPATKEQRDLLLQKMKEIGYEWDAEKKELRTIEPSCYYNDGLYYAIDILEKTFGKVEGYQSDDGKMEHQIAIETVNALYHKKPAEWSEEDKEMLNKLIGVLEGTNNEDYHEAWELKFLPWLKSLKPQSKQEWSEEDERMLKDIISGLEATKTFVYAHDKQGKAQMQERIDWIKSLKHQNGWKPSEEQMKWLKDVIETVPMTCRQQIPLESLYNDLKKL